MPWNTLEIEKNLKKRLSREFPGAESDEIFGSYTSARKVLVEDILAEIKAIEKDLTDHGVDHVSRVLQNIDKLLGDDVKKLNAIELLVLCLSALFHDVGNIHGRQDHQKNISDIHSHVRRSDDKFDQEKILLTAICGAHCGTSASGSRDTLATLSNLDNIYGKQVRSQVIAAILRFADELEEGIKRTSAYMIANHAYASESRIHNKYASIVTVFIDRDNNRIVLTYNINLQCDEHGLTESDEEELKEILKYVYKRIVKLDQERKFNKYYCELLYKFMKTEVTINFLLNGNIFPIGLPPISLTDKVIPGGESTPIEEQYEKYNIDPLINIIKDKIMGVC